MFAELERLVSIWAMVSSIKPEPKAPAHRVIKTDAFLDVYNQGISDYITACDVYREQCQIEARRKAEIETAIMDLIKSGVWGCGHNLARGMWYPTLEVAGYQVVMRYDSSDSHYRLEIFPAP